MLRFNSLTIRVLFFATIWAAIGIVAIALVISSLYRNSSERGFRFLLRANPVGPFATAAYTAPKSQLPDDNTHEHKEQTARQSESCEFVTNSIVNQVKYAKRYRSHARW